MGRRALQATRPLLSLGRLLLGPEGRPGQASGAEASSSGSLLGATSGGAALRGSSWSARAAAAPSATCCASRWGVMGGEQGGSRQMAGRW
eukprot:scaffold128944_cov30-Phaeocystis_antarctica.AAC.1